MTKNRKYIIGSGWWSDDKITSIGDEESGSSPIQGTTKEEYAWKGIYTPAFHGVWKKFLFKNASPENVIVVDSNAPCKPESDNRIKWLSLLENFPFDFENRFINKTYSGWERGFILGLAYSFLNNCDFIYVEQDCLISGESWVDKIYEVFEKDKFMVGDAEGIPWELQQSLVFVPLEIAGKFLSLILDNEERFCSPEEKWELMELDYQFLPFGYGRKRPVNWNDDIIYLQQLKSGEIGKLSDRENIDWKAIMNNNS